MKSYRKYLLPVLLLLAGWAAWYNTLDNRFLYDDDTFIVLNEGIRSLTPPLKFFSRHVSSHDAQMNRDVWRPLTTFSYALNYRLNGLTPRPYHLTNLALHLINGLLVFWLALLVLKRAAAGPQAGGDAPGPALLYRRGAAFLAALLFLLHPMQTETVAWVSQRSSLLSFFFYLLAFIAYARAMAAGGLNRRSALLYAASLAAFVPALLSKEMAASLPIALWGYDCLINRERPLKAAFKALPFAAVVIVFMLARSLALGQTAQTVYWAGGPVPQLLTMIKGFAYYVKFALIPYPLSVEYLFPVKRALDAELALYLALFAALGWGAWRARNKAPEISFGVFLFFAALAPVSNIIPIRTIINERFLYFSLFGFGLIAAGLARLAAGLRPAAVPRPYAVWLALLPVLLAYAGITMRRNLDWFDHDTFVTANLKTCPQSATLHYGMGRAYAAKGEFDKAAAEFELALKIDPEYEKATADLGRLAARGGDYDAAIARYRESVQKKVDFFEGLHNLGLAYFNKGDFKNAVLALEKAAAARPGDLEARNNLAAAYAYSGRLDKAIELSAAILKAAPGMVKTRKNLALFRAAADQAAQAEALAAAGAVAPAPSSFTAAYIKKHFTAGPVLTALAQSKGLEFEDTAEGLVPKRRPGGGAALKPEEIQALEALERRNGAGGSGPAGPRFVFARDIAGGYSIEYGGKSVKVKHLATEGPHAPPVNEEGILVYKEAYPATDVIYATADGGCEELILIKDKSGPSSFVYDYSPAPEITAGEELSLDGLVLSKPKVFDAKGREADGRYEKLDGGRIAMVFDREGLDYPLIIDPTWRTTDAMTTKRSNHSVTLLPDGKVLVAGGRSASTTYLSTAELYDPSTGMFSATGSMSTTRAYHTAVLLPNGKVLVAGGNNAAYLSTAELYDPAAGSFSTTGAMSVARSGYTATLLPDGKVLMVGGRSASSTFLSTAEIYDPSAGTFSTTGTMPTGLRADHTATLLPDGKVLVAGGRSASTTYLSTALLYNPSASTFSTTDSMNNRRAFFTATLLSNGKVLVVAGQDSSTTQLSTNELYDPSTETFANTGSFAGLSQNVYYHASVLLPNGKVLVVGGQHYDLDVGYAATNGVQLYDPSAGTFSTTTSISTARTQFCATLLPNGKVLLSGGIQTWEAPTSTAQLYDPAAGTFAATGAMSTTRTLHSATLLPNGKVLVAGGVSSSRLSTALLYDPSLGTFVTTGSMSTPRYSHTATLLPNGKVLVAGGYTTSSDLSTAELYDPSVGTFSATGAMSVSRNRHAATLLQNGNVLISGGYSSAWDSDLSSSELYNPSAGIFSTTGSMTTARYGHTATLLPNSKVLISGGAYFGAPISTAELYDPSAGTFSTTGSMSTYRWLHTATLLSNGKVLIAGGSLYLSTVELYNPDTGSFSATGSMSTKRCDHAATLLPNGKVLVTGGRSASSTYLSTVNIYDPATGVFTTSSSMSGTRSAHTATLLPNGKVLIAGGQNASYLSTAQLVRYTEYDYSVVASTMQPAISQVNGSSAFPVKVVAGETYGITGLRFKGYAEASAGGTMSSPTNYPRIYMRSLDNNSLGSDFLVHLTTSAYPLTWTSADTSLSFATPPGGLPSGYYMLYVLANAIPSDGVVVKYCRGANYVSKVGNADSWIWAKPDYCDYPNVPSGSAASWQWRAWEPGSGRQVPQGGASTWTWGSE
ncbi:MAG: kelch repeat-containing protein [Elusimicrobiales bacterium]